MSEEPRSSAAPGGTSRSSLVERARTRFGAPVYGDEFVVDFALGAREPERRLRYHAGLAPRCANTK